MPVPFLFGQGCLLLDVERDIDATLTNVCLWPKADILIA